MPSVINTRLSHHIVKKISDTEQSSSSSMSDTEEPSSWRSSLVDCLDDIQTAGDYSWTNTYDVFVNPAWRWTATARFRSRCVLVMRRS